MHKSISSILSTSEDDNTTRMAWLSHGSLGPQSTIFDGVNPDFKKTDEVVAEFLRWQGEPEVAVAVAAIKALTTLIRKSEATTVMGLEIELRRASEALKKCDSTSISLNAGCELFMRYVTKTSTMQDCEDLLSLKAHLAERGEKFAEVSLKARETIALLGERFVRDGNVVLVHGMSRCVLGMLMLAAEHGTNFSVICTEGRPDGTGLYASTTLAKAGIPVSVVIDSAVGFVMEKVDMVLVGAEGVVENGGVINKLGTYQIATVAAASNKPFYVAAESYKFARLYPLTQSDLPVENKPVHFSMPLPPTVMVVNPSRDFTPPNLITLLFTDLGILTPSAVSDELIQLYM
eukprot:jgi/Mesvir1/15612/Mv03219-RA.1